MTKEQIALGRVREIMEPHRRAPGPAGALANAVFEALSGTTMIDTATLTVLRQQQALEVEKTYRKHLARLAIDLNGCEHNGDVALVVANIVGELLNERMDLNSREIIEGIGEGADDEAIDKFYDVMEEIAYGD